MLAFYMATTYGCSVNQKHDCLDDDYFLSWHIFEPKISLHFIDHVGALADQCQNNEGYFQAKKVRIGVG